VVTIPTMQLAREFLKEFPDGKGRQFRQWALENYSIYINSPYTSLSSIRRGGHYKHHSELGIAAPALCKFREITGKKHPVDSPEHMMLWINLLDQARGCARRRKQP